MGESELHERRDMRAKRRRAGVWAVACLAAAVVSLAAAAAPAGARPYIYLNSFFLNRLSAFSVASDGSLNPVPGSPFHTGTWPWGVAVSPDGAHLFVVNNGSDTISSFSIAADGGLSPVPGSPFPTRNGARSEGVAVTPDGHHLYVPSGEGRNVVAFSIASDGSLSAIPGAPFATGGDRSSSVGSSPDGKRLYVTGRRLWGDPEGPRFISAFSIAADGALSRLAGFPRASEEASWGAVTPDQGPTAAFSATPTPAGDPTSLDAGPRAIPTEP